MKAAPPPDLMARYGLTAPTFVEETSIAKIWKVRTQNGQLAALKAYSGTDMGNESAGFSFLEGLDGVGVAKVYGYSKTAAVMEWLEGPSLGDLARDGNDVKAAIELVAVANQIHSVSLSPRPELPKLEHWFKALFLLRYAQSCSDNTRSVMARCQNLARSLFDTQNDIRPLHGDLHHDNVRLGKRGYCAFDAKGILGDRAYELANAFRNPRGAQEIVRSPDRIRYLATLWGEQFEVTPQRLLQWAAAKCGLSIAWRCKGTLENDAELDLLELFLSISDEL